MPGGSRRNLANGEEFFDSGTHDEIARLLVADAQTSGGLVFGVAPEHTDRALERLAETGHTAARIGSTRTGAPGLELR